MIIFYPLPPLLPPHCTVPAHLPVAAPGLFFLSLRSYLLGHALGVTPSVGLWPRIVGLPPRSQFIDIQFGFAPGFFGSPALPSFPLGGRMFVVVVAVPMASTVSTLALALVGRVVVVVISGITLTAVSGHPWGVEWVYTGSLGGASLASHGCWQTLRQRCRRRAASGAVWRVAVDVMGDSNTCRLSTLG